MRAVDRDCSVDDDWTLWSYDAVFAGHVALMRHHLVRLSDPDQSFLDIEDYQDQLRAAYRDLFTAAARRVLWIN